MARRGRFGRRPRAGGNLTSIVASLLAQQRAAEDKVMFDAWQNGGTVDGKPVTDQRLRGYIASRRDSFTKDDPLYDDWNNRLVQIDFKIGEDKVTLAFQQGKVGAGAVANFYKGQLNKIPKDSAFYRDVAGRAAQWAKATVSAARSGAGRRLASGGGLQAKSDAADKTFANAAAINDLVHQAAVRAGLINENEDVTQADASQLQDLFARGIPGPKGTTVSFNDWQHSLMAAYHSFDQKIAANKAMNRGTKTLQKDKAKFFQDNVLGANGIDDRAKYEAARDIWLEAVQDAQGDPRSVLAANAQYAKVLGKIQKDATAATGNNANPDALIGALQNEINALDGRYSGPGVADLYKRTDAGDFDNKLTSGDDTASTADGVKAANDDVKALVSGKAYYGQSEYGGALGVQYYEPGSELDPFGKHGLGPDSQTAIVNVNGKPTPIVLKGKPVQSIGLTDANGNAIEAIPGDWVGASKNVPIGNLTSAQVRDLIASGKVEVSKADGPTLGYVFTQGGNTTYGVIGSDGNLTFTNVNPFSDSGAFGLSQGGYVLIGGSQTNGNGDVVPLPPQVNVTAGGDSLMVDESVTPNELRGLAANAQDAEQQAQLTALADKRQKNAQAEADYMAKGQGKQKKQTTSNGPIDTAVGGINDIVRGLLGVAAAAKPANDTGAPPDIKLRDTDKGPLVPQIGAPPAINAPKTTIKPPTPAPPPVNPQGAPGAYRPPPPPPKPKPTNGSSQGQGGAPGAYRPPPPPPRPGANNPNANKQS